MKEEKYLKMPWSIEDTIENMKILKKAFQEKLIEINLDGLGNQDAKEVAFDFDRAIQALKENQEYKKLGTLEEVREAIEKQKAKKAEKISKGDKLRLGICPICKRRVTIVKSGNYCQNCGQRLEWSEEE